MTSPTVHPFLLRLLQGSDPETLLSPAPALNGWEAIVRDAAVHGLTPLLYGWLKIADGGLRLPPGLAARLDQEVSGVAARNMLLAEEMKAVLRAFEERRLPCAPIRGLALAERLYGDITARPTGDLDLLVHKEDLARVATTLQDLGFREMEHRRGFARTFSYTLVFLKERQGWVIVEPHWTIGYPPFVERVDMRSVWDRCTRGRVVGVDTWLLAQEELLLNLCLHLTHQGAAAPLIWLYDVDQLLRQGQRDFDWSRVLSIVREGELGALVAPVLRKVRALFASPVPDGIPDQLARESLRSVKGRLVQRLAGGSGGTNREELALLLTLKGVRVRLRYALGLLFPSPEFMRLRYRLTRRSDLAVTYVRRFCGLWWESLKGIAKLLA